MVGTLEAAVLTGLIVVGCLFLTVGTIGLLRFPNVYNRMHATSKPTTLGTAAIFTAGFVRFGPGGAGLTSLLGIFFLFLTVPTGAHLMARSAKRMGVPFMGSVTWPEPPDVDGVDHQPGGRDAEERGAASDADQDDVASDSNQDDVTSDTDQDGVATDTDQNGVAFDVDENDDGGDGDSVRDDAGDER